MKRIKNKFSRRDFMKNSAFISASAAGAGLMVGNNPELVASPANAQVSEDDCNCPMPLLRGWLWHHYSGGKR